MMINRIETGKTKNKSLRHICLTFDDGPDREYTPKILDILDDYNAKATFFIVGKNAEKHPSLVRRMYKEGHDIGNHSYSHPISPLIKRRGVSFIKREIEMTDGIIKDIIGRRPVLLRPSLAFWDLSSSILMDHARRNGHHYVGWTFSTVDWMGSTSLIRNKFINRRKKSGDIVLLHDGAENTFIKRRSATVRMLPEIIKDCRRNRFSVSLLSELL